MTTETSPALEDDFYSDLEASACYGDGAINPSQIIPPRVDADALEDLAQDIRTAGGDIATNGNDIVTSWGGLDGAYQGAQTERVLSAVDRVAVDGDTVETSTDGLATALSNFADDVRVFKARLGLLREQAVTMRERINEDEDWLENEDLVEEHDALLARVDTAQTEWQEAERNAANAITDLFDGPTFTAQDEMEGDGYSGNEIPYGFGEIPEDMDMPWGSSQPVSEGWVVDSWNGAADIVVGAVQDVGGITGLWHDGDWGVPIFGEQGRSNFTSYMDENLEGLSILTGFYDPSKPEGEEWGVDSFAEWTDNFLPAIREVGQGIVPTDEWDDRPGYVITQGVINIGLIAGGVALSFTGVGATAGVPMILVGLRNGLSAINRLGTSDIPNFHNNPDFSIPGTSVADLSRRGGNGGLWSRITAGTWFARPTTELDESVRGLGGNNGSEQRTGDGTERNTNDRNGSEDELNTHTTPEEVERGLNAVEDHLRQRGEHLEREIQDLNTRAGSEVFDSERVLAMAGAGAGDSPSLSSRDTITNSADGGASTTSSSTGGTGGTGSTDTTFRSGGSSHEDTTSSGSGNSGGSSGGNGSGDGYTDLSPAPRDGSSGGSSGSGGDGSSGASSSRYSGEANRPPYFRSEDPIGPSNKEYFPGPGQRFGTGISLKPNTLYEVTGRGMFITDSNGDIIHVETQSWNDSKGNPELERPRANVTYYVDNRSSGANLVYQTDHLARTVSVEGELRTDKIARNREQTDIGGEGRDYFDDYNADTHNPYTYETSSWDGGHFVAGHMFGGPGERINIVPMMENLNKSRRDTVDYTENWGKLEYLWKGLLKGDLGTAMRAFRAETDSATREWRRAEAQRWLDQGNQTPGSNVITFRMDVNYNPNLPEYPRRDGKTDLPDLSGPPSGINVSWELNSAAQKPRYYQNHPTSTPR